MRTYPSDFQLFCGPDCDETIAEAKEYIKKYWSKDEIRLVRKDGWVYVLAK